MFFLPVRRPEGVCFFYFSPGRSIAWTVKKNRLLKQSQPSRQWLLPIFRSNPPPRPPLHLHNQPIHPSPPQHPSALSPPPYCGCRTIPSLRITPLSGGAFSQRLLSPLRQGPTLLHLLCRCRLRHMTPKQCDPPPLWLWLQRLVDAPNYVAG